MSLEESEPLTVLPPGTQVFEPDDINQVTLQFPTKDDAIIFHEFLRSFVLGEIELEVVKKGRSSE